MSSPLLEAAILADHLADKAAARVLAHEADVGTADAPVSALGSAGAWYEADAEARKWQAVAAKLRAMARRGEG